MKRALVTGAEGFVGRHLMPKLREAGYQVVGTEKSWPYLPYTAGLFEVVVHLAANIFNVDDRMRGGMSMYEDIELDRKMCEYLELNPPTECAVLMSSCAVDNPEDPYCTIKRTLEAFGHTLHKKGVPVMILRPFSGYGEDQSLDYPFRAILERALNHEDPLTVWGGSQVRDFIHIDDLCEAILHGIKRFPLGLPIEVGTCHGTPLYKLAEMMAHAVGYDPKIHMDETKASSSAHRVAGSSRQLLAQMYGWKPKISLEEGIRRSVQSRQTVGV